MYVILLGAPGAGKGTQAAMLAQKLNLAHVATGDMFRQAIERGDDLGLKAKAFMAAGKLVPNEITIQMMIVKLAAPDCEVGAILDGFPRSLEQAQALDKALAQQKKAIDGVVYIKVAEDELMKRLGGRWICRKCQTPYHEVASLPKVKGICDKCGGELYQRPDDVPETIKKRLEVYFNETAPLIDYYKRSGKLLEVDGQGTIEEINSRIISTLKPKK